MKFRDHFASEEKWREAKKRKKKAYYGEPTGRKRRLWRKGELELVMIHCFTDKQLARILDRSVKSIQAARYRQKRQEGQ